MDRSRYHLTSVVLVFFVLAFSGCGGESTSNRFQQMAEARAARNRADRAEEEEEAKKAASEIPAKSVASAPKTSDTGVEKKKNEETKPQSVKGNSDAKHLVGAAEDSQLSTPAEMIGRLPIRDEVMQIGSGAKLAAYASESNTVALYDIETNSLIRKIYNPHLDPFSIAIGNQGNRMVVGGRNGSFKVFSLASIDGLDRFQQNRTRRQEASLPHKAYDDVITAVAISEPAQLVATGSADGVLKIWADELSSDNDEASASIASALSEVKSGETAIVSISFHADGKYVLSGNLDGTLSLWDRSSLVSEKASLVTTASSLAKPRASFRGLSSPISQSKVSPDGRYVLALYEDKENSVYAWDIETAVGNGGEIEPSFVVQNDVRCTSAALTSDSNYLLIGGSDGIIRASSLSEGHKVAKFRGHRGPVIDIEATAQPDQFVSGGSDKSFRSWRFPATITATAPANMPAKGGAVPLGLMVSSTKISDVTVPAYAGNLLKDDPFDAARQALISGAKITDVLDLMDVADKIKNTIKTTISSVMASEKGERESAKELSNLRRELTKSQEQLAPTGQSENLSVFSDNFSNLSFVGQTNFKFGIDKKFRPVELLFSDRFLYAARPSDRRVRRKRKNDDQAEIDYGDNGALLSWDYKYSRLLAHAWSIEDLEVRDLVSLPDSAGVLTVPQMRLFSQDGTSRPLANVASWSISSQPSAAEKFLAVGSEGALREESDILTIYDVSDFSNKSVTPYSQYRSYEGVVTAMAFAHNSPYVAFCVRERAVHRLFIADAQTLQLRKLEEINHSQPWLIGDDKTGNGIANRNQKAATGINALAFSPDDKMLVSHGQYDQEVYKFSRWDLAWDGSELLNFRKSRKELTNDTGPFFDDSGNEPIRFISRTLREDERNPDDENWQTKRTAGPSPKIIVQNRKGFNVVNLNTARAERVIPYLTTHYGVPEYAISEWALVGDGR